MNPWATPHTIANEVRMMRAAHRGAILIVEGATDKNAFSNLVDLAVCRIVIAFGKENALGAMEILRRDGLEGALAVVDADFDRLQGVVAATTDVFTTDLHDLECMMLASPAFTKILQEFAHEPRVQAFERQAGASTAHLLAASAASVGYLRWLSWRENLGLDFEGLDFGKFLDRETLRVDVRELIAEAKNHSQKHALRDAELEFGLAALRNSLHDPWQVSCGHDMLNILGYALRRTLGGARKEAEVSVPSLSRSLRLAYESSFFRETDLFRRLQEWERAHPPFRLFRG